MINEYQIAIIKTLEMFERIPVFIVYSLQYLVLYLGSQVKVEFHFRFPSGNEMS